MKTKLFLVLNVLFMGNTILAQSEKQFIPEQIALNCLFDSNVLDSLENTVYFTEFFSKLPNAKAFFGKTKTCGITMIGYAEDITNYESFKDDFFMKRDSVYSKVLQLPKIITKISWSNFKTSPDKYQGHYIFIRNAISNGKKHLVQISLIDRKVLANSIEIIFQINELGRVNRVISSFNSSYYPEDNKCG